MKAELINPVIKRLAFAAFTVFWLSGCATNIAMQITSLSVGCNTDDVKISDHYVDLNGTEYWTAECEDKKYSCNYLPESGSDCYELDE